MFNILKQLVEGGHRSVSAIEKSFILPSAQYADERLEVTGLPSRERNAEAFSNPCVLLRVQHVRWVTLPQKSDWWPHDGGHEIANHSRQ